VNFEQADIYVFWHRFQYCMKQSSRGVNDRNILVFVWVGEWSEPSVDVGVNGGQQRNTAKLNQQFRAVSFHQTLGSIS